MFGNSTIENKKTLMLSAPGALLDGQHLEHVGFARRTFDQAMHADDLVSLLDPLTVFAYFRGAVENTLGPDHRSHHLGVRATQKAANLPGSLLGRREHLLAWWWW